MSTSVYEQRISQTRMANETIKVLFVAGSGRSGTTIMARLLGELDGFVNVGEAARYLFDRHLQAKNLPCGCGQSVPQCPFWRDIVKEIPADVSESGAALVRMRTFPWLLIRGRDAISAQYEAILDAISGVYRRVAQETGCSVIVDSSKNPANALLVSLVPGVELHVVHVVRHPQNVVASWTKSKGYLAVHPARRVIAWWWSYNILAEALKLRAKTYRRIRYEDFVQNPAALLQQVGLDTVGQELPSSFLHGTEATVHMQHILAGNPDKFGSGKVKIGDTKTAVAGSRKLLVDLLTFPLQFRYRYLP
jgi:hypothetical protein